MWATPDDRNSPPRARPKKGKMVYFCQVDACRARLSSCKPYCLRYRVCPAHLNAGLVDVEGVASRFCQQCGKFHPLQEFDGTKKSCRTRLQHHNSSRQQRRKEAAQQQDFNTSLLLLHHPGTRNAARQLLRSSSSSSPKAAPGSSTADGGGSSSLAKLPSSSSSSMGTSAITTAAEGLTNSPSSKQQQQQQPDFVMVLSKGLCFRDDQQQDVKLEGASSDAAAAATAAMSAPHAAAEHTFRNVPPQQQQQQESAAHGSQITAVDNSSKQHSPPWQQQQLRGDTYAVLSRHNTADSSMAAASTAVQPSLSPSPPAAAAAAAQTLQTDASPSATAAAATRLESASSGLLTRQDSAVNDSQLQPWTQAMLRDGLGTDAANPAAAGSTGREAALYNAPNPAAAAAAARVPARVRGGFVAGSYARCTVPGCIDCVEGNITVHYCNVPGCTECPAPPPHVIAARQQQQMLGHQQPQQQAIYQNAPPSVSWQQQQQQQQEGIANAQGNASNVQLFAGLPMHTSSAWDPAPAAAAAAAAARDVHFSPNITMQHLVARQQQQQQQQQINMHYELSANTPAPCTSLYGNARASSNAAATRLTMHQASNNSTAAVWSQNSSSVTQGPPVTPNSYYTPTAATAGDSALYADSTPGAFNHTATAAADGASAARWQPDAAAAAASRDRGFKQIMPQMMSRNAVVSSYSRWSHDGAAAYQLGGSSSSSREDLNASVARLLLLPANAHVGYSSDTDAAAAIQSAAAAGSSFGNASDLGSAIMVQPQNASLPEHQLWSAAAAAGSGTAATHYQMAAAAAAEQLHYVQQGYNAPHCQVAFADTGSAAAAAAAAAAAVDGFHTNATYYNPAMSNYEQADNRTDNAMAPAAAMHDGQCTEHPSTARPAAAVGNFTTGSELGSQASYTTPRIGSTAAVATTAMHGGMYFNSDAAAGYAPQTHQQQQQQQQTMVSGFDQFQPAAYHDQQQQQQCLQLPRLLPKVAVERWTDLSATWQQQQSDAAAAAAWSAISPEAGIYGGARSVDVAAAASAYTSKGAFAAPLAAAHTNAVSMNNAMMQEGALYMPDHPTAAAVANAHAAAVGSAANMMISNYMPQQADQVQIRSGSVPVPDGQASLTDQAVPGPDTFWSPEGPDRQPPVLTDQAGTGSTVMAAAADADLLLPTLDTAAASLADDDHCQDSECKYLADFFQQWAGEGDDDVIVEDLMDSPTSWCERADQPL